MLDTRTCFLILAAGLLPAAAPGADPPRVDAFGDPLPPGAVARLGTSRAYVGGLADVTALPPDFKTFVGVQRQKGIVVQDRDTGRVVTRLTPEKASHLQLLTVSADGRRLATFDQGTIAVWELATGRRVFEFKPGPGVPSSPKAGDSPMASLSADGRLLAVGGWPDRPTKNSPDPREEVAATVWDVDRNQQLARVVVAYRAPLVPLLSADGKTLVTWSVPDYVAWPRPKDPPTLAPPPRPSPDPAKSLRVWDVATGRETASIGADRSRPGSVALSPDGRTLAAIWAEGPIGQWDARTGEPRVPIRRPEGREVQRLTFSPDGKVLAAIGFFGTARWWSAADGRLLGEADAPAGVPRGAGTGIGFAADGRVIAWGSIAWTAAVWEVPSRKILTPHGEHFGPVTGVGFQTGGKEVVTSGGGGWLVRWDAVTGKPIGRVPVRLRQPAGSILFSPYPLAPGLSPDAARMRDGFSSGSGTVYDLATGEELFTAPYKSKPAERPYCFASPDLKRVVIIPWPNDRKKTVIACEVWDMIARRKVATVELKSPTGFHGAPEAAFSPDGSRLVTAVYSGRPPFVPGQPPPGWPVLVIAGWDLASGSQLGRVELPDVHNMRVMVAAASNSSAVFTDGSLPLRAVDFEAGRLGFAIDERSRPGGRPVFSPDGTKFAVAGALGPGQPCVRVYDWPRGTLLHTLTGHVGGITALAFSPDGKVLASGSSDTTVLLWDLTAK